MPRLVKRSASRAVKPGRSRRGVPLPRFSPQLSKPVEKPPSGPQWLHEIKLDGFRMDYGGTERQPQLSQFLAERFAADVELNVKGREMSCNTNGHSE
jgi:hypothetical protein